MQQIINFMEPPLLIGDRAEVSLRGIARAAMARAPEIAARLLDEIDRAEVVTEADLPGDVVALGSIVTYRVMLTESVNTIQLVRPHEADLAKLRVSIVSGIGAALIGLQAGQRIQWELGGRRHVLEVLRVSQGLATVGEHS